MGALALLVAQGLCARPRLAGDSASATSTPIPATTSAPSPTSIPPATAAATMVPLPTPLPPPTQTPVRPPAVRPPTWIKAPAIHLDAPVVEINYKTTYLGDVAVTEWVLPAHAAGFHQDSAYPGNPGNTVLSGHNNIEGEVFRYLPDLEVGDWVILNVGSVAYHYRVATKEILPEKGMPAEVRLANARRIAPTDDERLTLVTCWPYTGNSHRVIVVAMPASPVDPPPTIPPTD